MNPIRPRSGDHRALRILTPLVLLSQATMFLVIWSAREGALLDDAYISFRYAARWAAGLGLTWNDGVWVEGFSNPVWTLTLGTLARVGLEPHLVAPWLGLACILFLTWLLFRLSRLRSLSPVATGILVAGIGFDVGLSVWAGSGLESVSAALLVAWWLLLAVDYPTSPGIRRGLALGLLGAVLALSRPEGIAWAAWGLLWLIWGAWAPRRVLVGWGIGMAPAVAYGIYRWITFGEVVPNTFFAKMEPGVLGLGNAVGDLGRDLIAHSVVILIPVAALVRRQVGKRSTPLESSRWLLLPGGWLVGQILFVLVVGGDWMGHSRYLVPVMPCLYLLVAELWDRRGVALAGGHLRLVLATLLLAHLGTGWVFRDHIPDYTLMGREIGLWLRSEASAEDTLAVSAAGAIPYFSGLPTYDVLGINDPGVAGRQIRHSGEWTPGHHRFDIEELMELRPTWIVWDFSIRINEHRMRKYRGRSDELRSMDYRQALFAHPDFRNLYTVHRNTPTESQNYYTVFRRR